MPILVVMAATLHHASCSADSAVGVGVQVRKVGVARDVPTIPTAGISVERLFSNSNLRASLSETRSSVAAKSYTSPYSTFRGCLTVIGIR